MHSFHWINLYWNYHYCLLTYKLFYSNTYFIHARRMHEIVINSALIEHDRNATNVIYAHGSHITIYIQVFSVYLFAPP